MSSLLNMNLKEAIVTAYTSQEYIKCLKLFESAPVEITNLIDMKILQASCLINITGRSGEAHQILDKILESEPSNGLAFYGKGLAFLKEGNLEKSFENFSKASELDTTGAISKAQVMKLKTEELLKSQRKSNRISDKQKKKYNSSPAKEISCEVCNRTFAQLFSLNRHKLIHSGERPHKCNVCSYGFVQKSDLQRHMSVHKDAADFDCNSCDKKFKSKKNLSLHLMTHGVEKPYKCDICEKDFKYRRLMKLHQIVHSKRRKYNCDFCEKIFVTKPSLKAHVMMHINRKNKDNIANHNLDNQIVKLPKKQYKKKASAKKTFSTNIQDSSNSQNQESSTSVFNLSPQISVTIKSNTDTDVIEPRSKNLRLCVDNSLDLNLNQTSNSMSSILTLNSSSLIDNKIHSNEELNDQASAAPRFSLPNIELPSSLQITPIFTLEAPKIRTSKSIHSNVAFRSSICVENAVSKQKQSRKRKSTFVQTRNSLQLQQSEIESNQISLMSTPHAAKSTDTLVSNEETSTDITKPTTSKWSVASNYEKTLNIKTEPMECDRIEAENSSNHDSLLSSENEHQNEWNLFFKSLMCDLMKMDDRQKRKFKQNTFMLIDDILQ